MSVRWDGQRGKARTVMSGKQSSAGVSSPRWLKKGVTHTLPINESLIPAKT